VTLNPLEIRGTPERSLSWHFSATVSSLLRLEGRVAPGQNWNHQVEFALEHAEQVLKPWFAAWPTSTLAGNWAGQVNGDGVIGRLNVKRGQIGALGLNGAIKFSDGGGAATIQPEVLMVNLASSKTPIRLTSGAVKSPARGSKHRASTSPPWPALPASMATTTGTPAPAK